MTTSPTAIIGEFVDASVRDRERAAELLAAHPDLIDARFTAKRFFKPESIYCRWQAAHSRPTRRRTAVPGPAGN